MRSERLLKGPPPDPQFSGNPGNGQRVFDIAPHQSRGRTQGSMGRDQAVGISLWIPLAIHEQSRHFQGQWRAVATLDQVQHQVQRRGGPAAASPVAVDHETIFGDCDFREGF